MLDSRTFKFLFLILIAIVPTWGAAQRANTDAADIVAINAMGEQWISYWNSGNGDGIASFYASGAYWMHPNGPNVVGKEAIGQIFGEGLATNGGTQFSTTDEVRVEGDVAYALGSWSITGGNGPDLDGEWLWVLNRQADGRWLVVRHISNETIPAQ